MLVFFQKCELVLETTLHFESLQENCMLYSVCKQHFTAIMENQNITHAILYFLQKPPEAVPADLPALSDLVPIISNQSQYINHLEAEVKFCKVPVNIFNLLKPWSPKCEELH